MYRWIEATKESSTIITVYHRIGTKKLKKKWYRSSQWKKEEFHLQSLTQDLGLMAVPAVRYPHIDFLQRHDVGIQRPYDLNRRLQPHLAVPVDTAVDVVGHDANDIW